LFAKIRIDFDSSNELSYFNTYFLRLLPQRYVPGPIYGYTQSFHHPEAIADEAMAGNASGTLMTAY